MYGRVGIEPGEFFIDRDPLALLFFVTFQFFRGQVDRKFVALFIFILFRSNIPDNIKAIPVKEPDGAAGGRAVCYGRSRTVYRVAELTFIFNKNFGIKRVPYYPGRRAGHDWKQEENCQEGDLENPRGDG